MTIAIRNSGSFKTANRLVVRNGGVWKPARQIWIKQSGGWVKASPVASGNTILRSGSGLFVVPATVTNLGVSYPTPLGIVNARLNVTPGQSIYYSIGDYGQPSIFDSITAPAYNREVMYWENEVDGEDFMEITMASSTGTGFFGDPAGSDNTTLYNQAIAAGCYYNEYYEWGHGDQYAIVRLYTVPSYTLVNPGKVVLANLNTYGRGGSGVDIIQQPTADNNYRAKVRAYDGGYSQWHQSWNLNVQQQVPFTITW